MKIDWSVFVNLFCWKWNDTHKLHKQNIADIGRDEQESTPSKPSRSNPPWPLTPILVIGYLLVAMCESLPAAFYPLEAEQKGLSKSEYGLVFGVYGLGSFLASPLVSVIIKHHIHPRHIYCSGILLKSTATIAFGLLEWVNQYRAFLALSIIFRILAAVGDCAAFVAAYVILTNHADAASSAHLFALMQLVYGMGYSVGPMVGESLFIAAGYEAPFLFLGGLLLIWTYVSAVHLWRHTNTKSVEVVTGNGDGSGSKRPVVAVVTHKGLLEFLRIPTVALQVLCFTGATMFLQFSFTILEPHLRQLGVTPANVGLIFFIQGGTLALFAPFVSAHLLPYFKNPAYLTSIGVFIGIVASLLIGPAPFLPSHHISLIIVGLFLVGISLAIVYTAAFAVSLDIAIKGRYDEPQALVSSIWNGFSSLGSFIAPILAGILTDLYGFSYSTLFLTALNSLTFVLLMVNEFGDFRPPTKTRRVSSFPEADDGDASTNEESPLLPFVVSVSQTETRRTSVTLTD